MSFLPNSPGGRKTPHIWVAHICYPIWSLEYIYMEVTKSDFFIDLFYSWSNGGLEMKRISQDYKGSKWQSKDWNSHLSSVAFFYLNGTLPFQSENTDMVIKSLPVCRAQNTHTWYVITQGKPVLLPWIWTFHKEFPKCYISIEKEWLYFAGK